MTQSARQTLQRDKSNERCFRLASLTNVAYPADPMDAADATLNQRNKLNKPIKRFLASGFKPFGLRAN